jgi:hypothetical protein
MGPFLARLNNPDRILSDEKTRFSARRIAKDGVFRKNSGMFIHHVYFWLKADAPASAKDQLVADCRAFLGRIPKVQHLWVGPPAMTPRDVVDNSYAVGLAVVLPDKAAHDVYQGHPLHLEFIARNKAHWERVRVFDFEG